MSNSNTENQPNDYNAIPVLYCKHCLSIKVVENGHMFKQDFLEKCINEIEDIMTVPEESEDNKEETPDKSEE